MRGFEMVSTEVEQYGFLHISGDVVPPEFFQAIKFDSGKPDLLSVLILSNLLYWYRPVKPRDERTDRATAWRQKFQGEMLSRTYQEWADIYGATERQARDACHRLQARGLIVISCKPCPTGGTTTYFAPVFQAVRSLLQPPSRLTPERESGQKPTHVETLADNDSRQNVSRDTLERESLNKERARVETTLETKRESDQQESVSKPKLALVSSVGENPHLADQPFSPNDDFSQPAPRQEWTVGERFILKACGLWDDLANQEKPIVETNWKTKQAVQAAGKYVAARLNVKQRIGGTPKMFLEFWHDTLKRSIAPRPEYVVEQWEAYDRWLVENYETHRRIAA